MGMCNFNEAGGISLLNANAERAEAPQARVAFSPTAARRRRRQIESSMPTVCRSQVYT